MIARGVKDYYIHTIGAKLASLINIHRLLQVLGWARTHFQLASKYTLLAIIR